MQLEIHEIAPHEAPMSLLLEADPSETSVLGYLSRSTCFLATRAGRECGVALVVRNNDAEFELMNIAVVPERQQAGIGTALLQHVVEFARSAGAARLVVGTGTFGYQLKFYQRAGFRVIGVERDHFLRNYAEPLFESGVQHKDMLRLAVDFTQQDAPGALHRA